VDRRRKISFPSGDSYKKYPLIGFSKIVVEHLEREGMNAELLINSVVQPVFKEFHISRATAARD
jgi:hypothetical protein